MLPQKKKKKSISIQHGNNKIEDVHLTSVSIILSVTTSHNFLQLPYIKIYCTSAFSLLYTEDITVHQICTVATYSTMITVNPSTFVKTKLV